MTNLPPIEINPETFLYNHCELPALPEIITKVQKIMLTDEYTAKKVSDIIDTDPAIVAEILKIVNSAYYSFPKEIKDVKFAVAYMGIVEIQRIIMSMSIINTLASDDIQNFNKIWFHSVFTAFIAKYLVQKYEPLVEPGEIWSAAILHDVGKLVYLKFFPKHFNLLIKYTEDNGCFFSEAEQFYKFPSSSYLGKLLCDRWRLPTEIKNSCMYHGLNDLSNTNDKSMEATFKKIVCASNLLAILMEDKLKNEFTKAITEEINKLFNITESEFMLLAADLSELKISAEHLLSKK